MTAHYENLSSKRPFCENRLSDSHSYRKAIHSVCFLTSNQPTKCYISRGGKKQMEAEIPNIRSTANCHCSTGISLVTDICNDKYRNNTTRQAFWL